MLLPSPSLEKILNGQHRWPTEKWSADVLHLGCGSASVYSARDLRAQSIPRTLAQDHKDRESPLVIHQWRRVRFSCVERCSNPPSTLFVCLTSTIAAQKQLSTIFERPRVGRCP